MTEALDGIERAGTDIVLDLTRTAFVDSTILGVIVRHAVKPGERVVAVAPGDTKVAKVLELVQLGNMVRMVETRDEALVALDADPA